MAIDTADKRASAGPGGLEWLVVPPIPDGTIDADDRAHSAGFYRGIVAAVIVTPLDGSVADSVSFDGTVDAPASFGGSIAAPVGFGGTVADPVSFGGSVGQPGGWGGSIDDPDPA